MTRGPRPYKCRRSCPRSLERRRAYLWLSTEYPALVGGFEGACLAAYKTKLKEMRDAGKRFDLGIQHLAGDAVEPRYSDILDKNPRQDHHRRCRSSWPSSRYSVISPCVINSGGWGEDRIAKLWEGGFTAIKDGFLDYVQQRRRSRQLSEIAMEEPTYDGGATSTPASIRTASNTYRANKTLSSCSGGYNTIT